MQQRCTWRQLVHDEVGEDGIWGQGLHCRVGEGAVEGPEAGACEVEEGPGGQSQAPRQAHGLQQLLHTCLFMTVSQLLVSPSLQRQQDEMRQDKTRKRLTCRSTVKCELSRDGTMPAQEFTAPACTPHE